MCYLSVSIDIWNGFGLTGGTWHGNDSNQMMKCGIVVMPCKPPAESRCGATTLPGRLSRWGNQRPNKSSRLSSLNIPRSVGEIIAELVYFPKSADINWRLKSFLLLFRCTPPFSILHNLTESCSRRLSFPYSFGGLGLHHHHHQIAMI